MIPRILFADGLAQVEIRDIDRLERDLARALAWLEDATDVLIARDIWDLHFACDVIAFLRAYGHKVVSAPQPSAPAPLIRCVDCPKNSPHGCDMGFLEGAR